MTSKLKTLISWRQKSLVLHSKDSTTFKYWRNRVQQECKTCRKNFNERTVAALKDSNVKRWWKEIKGLTGQRSTTDSWVFQMLDENIPSLTALADCFNDFLAGLTAHFVPLDLTDCELDLEVPMEFLVDQSVVYKALRQIKPKKSPGPSPIPQKILKEFAAELCRVLTDIYNSSLKQGYVPAQLKESLVRPLPKVSPPKSVDSDLRPITLTAQIAKIMKGFTLSSLYSQVIDNIDFLQFALPGKSTTHALIYILHCILQALETGHCYARILFTDFSKGFDLVDHNVLCTELRNLGVHNVLITWIGSFLTNRSQLVKISSAISGHVLLWVVFPKGLNWPPCCLQYLLITSPGNGRSGLNT